jgi:hypothetical protein
MYFAIFHLHLRYGIQFWGEDRKSIKILKMQKNVTRLNSNVGRDASCRVLFNPFRSYAGPRPTL